jgi:GTP cyclohydrolase II
MKLPISKIRSRVKIPLKHGIGEFISFTDLIDNKENIAIVFGNIENEKMVLVRIHSECLTGDVFKSGRCDCGEQLNEAIVDMSKSSGVLLYLRQEGRGIGLYEKLAAYKLQDSGLDTYSANIILGHKEDHRDYKPAAQMINALGIQSIELMTNNPDKKKQLVELGIDVKKIRQTGVFLKSTNIDYLKSKVFKTGHELNLEHIPLGLV